MCAHHCESGEERWLQALEGEGEAALQTHSCRDADPQPVIPQNKKIIPLAAETREKYQPDHHSPLST